MNKKVLVAFASKHGATRDMAQVIGEQLQEAGHEVKICPVTAVEDLYSFDAVIVGSAIYVGNWRKSAVKFLEDNVAVLAKRHVWLFASGPTGDEPDEDFRKYPPALDHTIELIQPQDVVIFGGRLEPDELNPLERFMIRRVDAPTGDFRNWESIHEWADSIDKTLKSIPVS